MNTGKQQPIQRYSVPANLSAKTDTSAPLSFKEWYDSRSDIIPDQEYVLYNKYLTDWFFTNGKQVNSTNRQIQLNYLALLRQLQLFFSKEEQENWYNNIDITNDKELLLAIPYFAKKLKEISLYYLQLRKAIKETRLTYNQVGINFGITQQIQNFILNNYTQKPDSLITLPASIWRNVPALSAVNQNINIVIEELYDDHNYFDQTLTLPISTYYNTNDYQLQKFLSTKGLALTSTDWIYNLGRYALSADPLTNISVLSADLNFQSLLYNNIDTLSKIQAQAFLGQNKFNSTASYNPTIQQDKYNVFIEKGNNAFYWPDAIYKQKAIKYPRYQPILLTDMGLETLGTGGSSIDTADTIFVETATGVQGAWLYNEVYSYSYPTMQTRFKPSDSTAFIYPFPGYGLSAEDITWTGADLIYTPQFNYLNEDIKQSILNAYWSTNVALSTITTPIKINDTALIDNKAFSSKDYNFADIIKIRSTPPAYDTPGSYTDTSNGAWLYRFYNTDISIAPNGTSVIAWPFEKIDPAQDFPTYYPSNLTNFCLTTPVSSLNAPFAIASNALSSADVLYKVLRHTDDSTAAIQCCWLSGTETTIPVANTSSAINTVNQSTLQAIMSSGNYTRFVWNGPDNTDVNIVFQTLNHQPDCKFVTTPNTTYLDHKLCTCKQVLFAPFGHPGTNYSDYSSLGDFIIQDTSSPGNFNLNTWKDPFGNTYQNSRAFFWYKTNNTVGWGDGAWVNVNGAYTTTKLQKGTPYIYYRATIPYTSVNGIDVNLPELVLRYTYPNYTAQSVWIEAILDSNNNWVSTGNPTQMIINPGDILLYSRAGSTWYSLTGTIDTPQDISLNINSIWSNLDYMSIGTNVLGTLKSFQFSYPAQIYTNINELNTTDAYGQYPPLNYTNILAYTAWSLSSQPSNSIQYFLNTPSFNFTPTKPGLYTTSLTAITANGLGFTRYVSSSPPPNVGLSGIFIFRNIPPVTAIPSTITVPSLTSYTVSVPGYVLNTPLKGWNYNTISYSTDYNAPSPTVGARPYWGKIYNQKDKNTNYKGIESQGTPLRLVDNYNFITQPEISDIQLTAGIYVEYINRNIYDLYWNQPLSLATYINSNSWRTLNFSTTGQSNLSYQLNNINTELVVTPTTATSNLTIQNYVNNQPVKIYYNANNSFNWTITATPVDTVTIYNDISANLLIESLTPWSNLLNQFNPTIAAFPAFEDLYSAKDAGGFFTPQNLGTSVYTNQNYTATLLTSSVSLTGIFEDSSKTVGARGFTKTDNSTPYVITLDNNTWLKENTLSTPIAGNVNKKIFKKYQKFLPYQSTYETNPHNNIGIILPGSRQSPWGGEQDSQWTDIANKPVSFTGTYNVSAWSGAQILKQNQLQLDNWVTDIFGNQYGLYKNIKNVSPVSRRSIPGQVWTRNSLQAVAPATASLSSIYSIYSSITGSNIYNDLTGNRVNRLDTFFDVLYIETSGCVLLNKINYDYITGTISSTPDISRGLSLAMPVTASLVREFSNINLRNYTYALVGDRWFFPEQNLLTLSVCGVSGTNITPELYQYDIKTYFLKKVFPLNQTDVAAISGLNAALNLVTVDPPVLSYNELTSNYLLAILTKDNNGNDNLVEIVINNTKPLTIETITVYNSNNTLTIVDPPFITQNLTTTLSATTSGTYTVTPNTSAIFTSLTLPSWVTLQQNPGSNTGIFTYTAPALSGTYLAPFYVSNNIGPTYYTFTINVTGG